MNHTFNCRFHEKQDEKQNLGFFWGVVMEVDRKDTANITLHGRRMHGGLHGCLWEGYEDPLAAMGFNTTWLNWLPYVITMGLARILLPRTSLPLRLTNNGWVRRQERLIELVARDPKAGRDHLIQLQMKSSEDALRAVKLLKTPKPSRPR